MTGWTQRAIEAVQRMPLERSYHSPSRHRRARMVSYLVGRKWDRIPGDHASKREFEVATYNRSNAWVPACGGTEQPFTAGGLRVLYVFNPATMEHRYLDLGTDMLMPDTWSPNA
jgi:hypothetical protein